ncbi:MAG: rhodanese-like domain-containing protein [Spirochaetae bacterium HGW-Spirochaetae-8]|jgi:rhodanese-related sulfurtransferase|nr:MAG: rhodanese-like domain-containing protein [Spirochaetae bacterium HGW-Spirochaetae-8]
MGKVFLGLGVLAIVLVVAGCAGRSKPEVAVGAPAPVARAQYRKISPQEAKSMMADKSVIILDVRTEAEFTQGHIEGAILIPNETITTTVRPAALTDLNAVVLVYCRSGNRSSQAAKKLVTLGYAQVYDFGGIIDWPYEVVR